MKNKYIPNNINSYKDIFEEKVRWGDTDGYNHVNNVSISRYFESARVNIIRNLETDKHSFVLVHFNIDYLDQIFYPSIINIGTSLKRVGNKSITFDQAIFVDNKCKSIAQSILAYADIKEKKSYNITDITKKHLLDKYGASDEI